MVIGWVSWHRQYDVYAAVRLVTVGETELTCFSEKKTKKKDQKVLWKCGVYYAETKKGA